ncbi:protein transport protein Sec16A isoform X2 [Lingula anatina]|uniref:Protein transport protein sec16 n=1 Tax=Lingula anatina TaxID=7574 RepID=A0A1S3JYQ7_LINAN|nr:protein transport protein Sec16A isoform X2 [Lingula anatina]|eukprot:XP_013415161.1 protein transport protein Sec16A isoform X2 [Lingula anatina]
MVGKGGENPYRKSPMNAPVPPVETTQSHQPSVGSGDGGTSPEVHMDIFASTITPRKESPFQPPLRAPKILPYPEALQHTDTAAGKPEVSEHSKSGHPVSVTQADLRSADAPPPGSPQRRLSTQRLRDHHNMSPATTLWENPAPLSLVANNILLAPAASTISPMTVDRTPVKPAGPAGVQPTLPAESHLGIVPHQSDNFSDTSSLKSEDVEVSKITAAPGGETAKPTPVSKPTPSQPKQNPVNTPSANQPLPLPPSQPPPPPQQHVNQNLSQKTDGTSISGKENAKDEIQETPKRPVEDRQRGSRDQRSNEDTGGDRGRRDDRPDERNYRRDDDRLDDRDRVRPGDRDREEDRDRRKPRYDRYGRPYDDYDRDRDRYRPSSRQGYDDDRSRGEYDSSADPSPRGSRPEDRDGPRSRSDYDRDRPRYRDDYDRDRPRSRTDYDRDRPQSRTDYDRDRPRSRTDYDRDRPRSRADYDRDRPSSRTDYDRDRPRSRNDYDRDRGRYRPSSRNDDGRRRDRDYYSDRRDPYYSDPRYSKEYYDYYKKYYGYGSAEDYYNSYYYGRQRDPYSKGYAEEMKLQGQQPYDDRYRDYYARQYSGSQQYGYNYDYSGRGSQPGSRSQTPGMEDPYAGYYSDPHNQSYADYYNQYYYGDTSYSQQSQAGAGQEGQASESLEPKEPARMTPVKFSIPHVRATFSACGHLVKVLPNCPSSGEPAMVHISDLESVIPESDEAEELRIFPGPLIKGQTHKNDVIAFCMHKAKECRENVNMIDRESAELLWKFLVLLIKQNGTVVGTDVSELLLEGHEPTTREYNRMGMKIVSSAMELDALEEESDSVQQDSVATGDDLNNTSVTSDRSFVNKRGLLRDESVDRFRHLLLFGRKKDALECAMKNQLWGHALFLASKMDNRTYANVMTRFANSAMKMNDPLQTMYQLLSGRQPAAVTCISEEGWGDWRPHLAMILSNTTPKPELDRKSISTLGDSLASRGYLHASHFCYLMAQVKFGTFERKTSKIVLIGSNHNLSLDEFAVNLAIQCTEIYEYAQSLGSPYTAIPTFQPYKFMYACRLAELGYSEEALTYCEVISSTIQQAPGAYSPVLVKQLYELGSRLKYHDPQTIHSADGEFDDPYWLKAMPKIMQAFQDGSIQYLSGADTPAGFLSSAGSEDAEGFNQDASMTHYQSSWQQQQQSLYQGIDNVDAQQQLQGYDTQQYQGYYQQPEDGQLQQQRQQGDYQFYNPQAGFQGYDSTQQIQDVSQSQDIHDQTGEFKPFGGHDLNLAESYGSNYTTTTVTSTGSTDDPDSPFAQSAATTTFDYYDMNTAQQAADQVVENAAQATRTRTVSGSSTGSVIFRPHNNVSNLGNATSQRVRTTSTNSYASTIRRSSFQQPVRQESAEEKPAAPPPTKEEKKKDTGAKKGGWLSGIFRWPKGKNEMKLPDDSNPSIVWDPVKNRWVNTDGEEEETTAAPPPKDTDLMGGAKPAPAIAPPGGSTGAGTDMTAPPPPAGNKFSRPKARGARNQYVDVMNPTSASAAGPPLNLLPMMPAPSALPANLFIPPPAPEGSDAQAEGVDQQQQNTDQQQHQQQDQQQQQQFQDPYQQQQQQQQPPQSQFYNPGQFAQQQIQDQDQLSRSSSMSSLSREVQQFTQEGHDTAAPPSGPPMMFNPASFGAQPSSVPAAGPGRGPKYGQRRQYPH